MRLEDIVMTSRAVAQAGGRLTKIAHLAELLRRLQPMEVAPAVAFLSGEPRQGRIGLGPAAVWAAKATDAAAAATLRLADVDEVFGRIAGMKGPGSSAARVQALRDLLRRATADEQDFLVRLLFGELRQGALEGVLVDAVARASGVRVALLRRAIMMAGDVSPVACAALGGGEAALAGFSVRLFQPVQPMLAHPAATLEEALDEIGAECALEWKLDGARIQAHKSGQDVKVFSRNLREVTHAVPEVVEAVRSFAAADAIVDGEVIALRTDG